MAGTRTTPPPIPRRPTSTPTPSPSKRMMKIMLIERHFAHLSNSQASLPYLPPSGPRQQPYGQAATDEMACATCKWKLGRPSALPVIFKAAVEMTAAQSENRVGSPYSPEHARPFEAGADYSLAARFDHTRANKQMLAPKLGISHALRIPRKVVRFRAYLLGNVGIVSIHGT